MTNTIRRLVLAVAVAAPGVVKVRQDDLASEEEAFEFELAQVFDQAASQAQVFEDVAPLVVSAIDGYNARRDSCRALFQNERAALPSRVAWIFIPAYYCFALPTGSRASRWRRGPRSSLSA